MKVVLTKDIERVGQCGSILEVKDGFARNFLLPHGFARAADEAALAALSARNSELAKKRKMRDIAHENLRERLGGLVIKLYAKANEQGHLFAGIDKKNVIDALRKQGFREIAEFTFNGLPIKNTGEHEISVKIGDATVVFKIIVEPAS